MIVEVSGRMLSLCAGIRHLLNLREHQDMPQLELKPASCLQVLSNKFSIILLILSFAYLSISLDMSGYFKVGGAGGGSHSRLPHRAEKY